MARISVAPPLSAVVLVACLATSALTALVWWSGAPGYSAAGAQADWHGRAQRHAAATAERITLYRNDLSRALTAFAPRIVEGEGNQGAALLGGLGVQRICVLAPGSAGVVRSFPADGSPCAEVWPLDLRIRLAGLAAARGVTMTMLRPEPDAVPGPFVITRAYEMLVVAEISPARLEGMLRVPDPALALRLIDPAGHSLPTGAPALTARGHTLDVALGLSGWTLRTHVTGPAGSVSAGAAAARGQVLVLLLAGGGLALVIWFVTLNGFLGPLGTEIDQIHRLAAGQQPVPPPVVRTGAAPREATDLRRAADQLAKRLDRQTRSVIRDLPRKGTPIDQPTATLAPPPPRTLLVDPNPAQGRALVATFAALGARAELCETGAAAEARLEHAALADSPFKLVLINATLPDMPSAALLRRLKAHYPGPALEILGMTSPAQVEELAPDLRPGLVKPVGRDALMDVFRALADKSKGQNIEVPAEPHALVFDADIEDPSTLTLVLGEFDLALRLADDADEGLEALKQGALPDLVLVDISMPGLAGVSTIRRIATCRGRSGDPSCRIIAMSPVVSDVLRRAAVAAGAEAVLPKPLDMTALRALLSRRPGTAPLTQPDPVAALP